MELKGHTIGFKGEYSATVLKADGTVKEFLNEEKTLRSGDVIKNLLLDNFFAKLISEESPISTVSIRCGTGTNPVSVAESSLNNQLLLTSGSWPSSSGSGPTVAIENNLLKGSVTYTFTFSLGQLSGNISELGVNFTGITTASNTLIHSRALVVDNLNNPTTITVTSQEQLIITYTLRMEANADDVVSTVSVSIAGVPTDITVTARWCILGALPYYVSNNLGGGTSDVTVFDGSLNPIGVLPSGSNSRFASKSYSYNVSGGKITTVSYSISQANLAGGISALISGATASKPIVKFGFNPPLPKNSDRTLSITIRQTFGRLP